MSRASQQTQEGAQKSSLPTGKPLSPEVKGTGCSSEHFADFSLFQTIKNLVWNMLSNKFRFMSVVQNPAGGGTDNTNLQVKAVTEDPFIMNTAPQ